jgi:hypothetical protein
MSQDYREQFIEAARQHGIGTEEGNSKAANKAYFSLIEALRGLRALPDKGASFLEGLLSNSNPSVVTWAALYLLPYNENMARTALNSVVDLGLRLISFDARMTLKEWDAGRLHIE